MKSMLAFAAGVLVGVLVTLGGNRFLHSVHPSLPGSGTPSIVVSVMDDVSGRLSSLLDPLLAPAPRVLRYRVSHRLRMARTGVVLSQHIPSDESRSALAAPADAGHDTPSAAPQDQEAVRAAARSPQDRSSGRTAPETGPEQRYALALEAHMSGRQEEARSLFASFLGEFPSHGLAANALYWTGETWYTQARYDRAGFFFARVVREHPGHAKSPDALLKMAYSAMRQGRSGQARAYLDQLLKRYPDSGASRLGRQARGRLEGRSGRGTMVVTRG